MIAFGSKKARLLFIGDLVVFGLSLALSLGLRDPSNLSGQVLLSHYHLFGPIFLVWLGVFFIFDLYGYHTTLFRRKLPQVLLTAQLVNIILAISFFYFLPVFGLTPKVVLFINLFITTILIYVWRQFLTDKLNFGQKEKLFFVGDDVVVNELKTELANNSFYNTTMVADEKSATGVVLGLHQGEIDVNKYYHYLLTGRVIIPLLVLYEEVFGRVPVAIVDERWLLENLSRRPKIFYDSFKRLSDIIISVVLLIVSLPCYPLVMIMMLLFDHGPLFSFQTRVGLYGRPITLIKFRTMTLADGNGKWQLGSPNQVTRLGHWWRRTRIDELPQLWNVLKGDLSLIGPRPEFPQAVDSYCQQIPFYQSRLLVKPGLSGWAQVYHQGHPHHGLDMVATTEKLSYDLYYLKNRSWWLDLKISLKTLKILLAIQGR